MTPEPNKTWNCPSFISWYSQAIGTFRPTWVAVPRRAGAVLVPIEFNGRLRGEAAIAVGATPSGPRLVQASYGEVPSFERWSPTVVLWSGAHSTPLHHLSRPQTDPLLAAWSELDDPVRRYESLLHTLLGQRTADMSESNLKFSCKICHPRVPGDDVVVLDYGVLPNVAPEHDWDTEFADIIGGSAFALGQLQIGESKSLPAADTQAAPSPPSSAPDPQLDYVDPEVPTDLLPALNALGPEGMRRMASWATNAVDNDWLWKRLGSGTRQVLLHYRAIETSSDGDRLTAFGERVVHACVWRYGNTRLSPNQLLSAEGFELEL